MKPEAPKAIALPSNTRAIFIEANGGGRSLVRPVLANHDRGPELEITPPDLDGINTRMGTLLRNPAWVMLPDAIATAARCPIDVECAAGSQIDAEPSDPSFTFGASGITSGALDRPRCREHDVSTAVIMYKQ